MILYKSGIDGKMFLTQLEAVKHNEMILEYLGKDKKFAKCNVYISHIETEKDKKIKLINKKLKEIEKDFTEYEKD